MEKVSGKWSVFRICETLGNRTMDIWKTKGSPNAFDECNLITMFNHKMINSFQTSAAFTSRPVIWMQWNDWSLYQIRGGSRAAAPSKMECFVTIVNGFQPFTIITKHSILDVASALDPLLQLVLHSWQLNFLVLVAGPLFILIGHMIILFFFLNVIKMYMSTVSFLVHLEFFVCLQNGFVWSMI